MSNTTFGYDLEQDRLWMMYAEDQPRIWVTRHIAQGIAGALPQLIEQTTTGVTNDSPAKRAEIEHRLAVRETPDGGVRQYPYQIKTESKESLYSQGFVLCTALNAQVNSGGGFIKFIFTQGDVKFDFNRYDLHVWLRAFRMVIKDAKWNLHPALPAWLDEPLLPSSIQKLLTDPLPSDLDPPEPKP